MKQCKLVVFDMDGTILDSLEDLSDSTNYALREHHMPERSIEEVRSFVGNGIGKLIERAVPEGTEEELQKTVLDTFKGYYMLHCTDKTKPYEGILELLRSLREKGFLTAVVSNKVDAAVQDLCRDFFPGLFDMAVGEKEGIRKKPAPDSVFAVLEKLQIKKEQAVYIGDSDVDLDTAKNAGMEAIAVEWGFRTREFLQEHGAKQIVSTPAQILEALEVYTESQKIGTVGLVMEGGGMRGLFTAGVLDVFMENRITAQIAVGVSAGAVFGCNYKSHQWGRVLRYNKRFCKDKRFAGIGNWIKTGNIYTKEFAYGRVPYELDIFDQKTYEKDPMKFYVVATDAATGKPEYKLCMKGDEQDIEWMRASAAIPMACKAVPIDGKEYYDGGVGDSIPVQWMQAQGCAKVVVILTRPAGYRKEPRKSGLMTRLMLRKYPNMIQAMAQRHKHYNATLDYILEEEKKGNIFVIRPSQAIDMPMLSPEPEDIQRVYDLGRKDALSCLKKCLEYLQ